MKKLDQVLFPLDQEAQMIIVELVNTCRKVKLGNLEFQYFETQKNPEVHFYLSEKNGGWDLTVAYDHRRENDSIPYRDCYQIPDEKPNEIIYEYSEWDPPRRR